MYSMVLMAAMTTSPAIPDWGRRGWGGCCGCYGGYGGYGWGGWGCYGGWGSGCYGWGGYGGWGGWGGRGYGYGYGGWGGRRFVYAPTPVYGTPVVAYGTAINGRRVATTSGYTPSANGDVPARLIVHLPADATLTINGTPTRSTSDTRTFETPPLEPGKTYHYTLRATINRNGEKENASQDAVVRAGKPTEVYMEFPTRKEGAAP